MGVEGSGTHADILREATRFSPTGFRRRREGQQVPKMDFNERINNLVDGELSDQMFGPLSIEQKSPIIEDEEV